MDKLIFFKRASLVLLVFLIITNGFLLWWVICLNQEKDNLTKDYNARLEQFELLSPKIAWLDVESFLANQNEYSLNYFVLRKKLVEQTENTHGGVYGIYFQDFNTGASIGINEKE
ncbi:MAG: hypothetical protein KKF67_00025, partial [Nanoarchaeota archaeon]|nr:hypothetical protein [Nanoarchaeota archaeon]